MPETEFERESDAPVGWVDNNILIRNARGVVLGVIVPDDVGEVANDAADN